MANIFYERACDLGLLDGKTVAIIGYGSQGQAHFKAMRKLASEHMSEKIGEDIRKLYSWSDENKLINN